MIPPCRRCYGTGRVYEEGPLYEDCPAPGPTLLDRDGNPVHADLDGLRRWCLEHGFEAFDDPPECWIPDVERDAGPCDPGWATVTIWQEA